MSGTPSFDIAREHFAKAESYLALPEASPETIRPEAAIAAATLASVHLHAAEFATKWQQHYGISLRRDYA
jgi:hypothetical protein